MRKFSTYITMVKQKIHDDVKMLDVISFFNHLYFQAQKEIIGDVNDDQH